HDFHHGAGETINRELAVTLGMEVRVAISKRRAFVIRGLRQTIVAIPTEAEAMSVAGFGRAGASASNLEGLQRHHRIIQQASQVFATDGRRAIQDDAFSLE